MRHALLHDDAAARQGGHLLGVVRQQPDPAKAQAAQHLGGRQIDPLVGVETQLLVGLDGVGAAVLQAIGAQLVHQADAAALLRQVEQQSGPRLGDGVDRAAQLIAAVAPQAAQEVAGKAFGMQPGQHGAILVGLADHHRQMLEAAVAGPEGDDPRVLGALQGHPRLGNHLKRTGRRKTVVRDLLGGDGEDVFVLRPGGPIAVGRQGRDQRRRQEPRQLHQVDGGAVQAARRRRRGRVSRGRPAAAGRIGELQYLREIGAGDVERDHAGGRQPVGGVGDPQAGRALGGEQQQRRRAVDAD